MIFLSVLFSLFALIFKKSFLLFFQLILIICYFLQYSAKAFEYFMSFKEKPYRYMGFIVEAITYTVVGLTLASYNLINKIKDKKEIFFVNIIALYL
jgi:hypothetical protein